MGSMTNDPVSLLRARARYAQAALGAAQAALQAAEERAAFQAKEQAEQVAIVAEVKAATGQYRA